ncbi:transmembrane sensor [Pedobacter sp. UYP30]|uniref:FecR family protein n=1 Tax=Pedobacter sp. UYP30 TaxID=1756400 RepID=UPI003398D9CA
MDDFKLSNDEIFYVSLILEEKQGTIFAADAKVLSEWRSLNKENNLLYTKILEVEDDLALLETYRSLDVEDSLAKLHRKLAAPQQSKNKGKIVLMKWMAIAACLVLVLFGIYYIGHNNDRVTLETAALQSKMFVLPDGSKLTLNGKTLLTFSKKNFKKERKLTLVRGECFFEVVHNERSPFSVHYKSLTITDIGTAFNVRLEKNQVNVIVNNGKVQMSAENLSNQAYLNAGESAVYSLDNGKIEKSKLHDVNYKAYVDHSFYFNNSQLSEVIASLNNAFHQKIVLVSPTLKTKRLTAAFKNQTLTDILEVIAKSLNLKVTVKHEVMYITD